MTQAKLNTELYQKMFAEQKLFQAKLLLMPPTETPNHAYENVLRENILLSLKYNDLSCRQAHILLKLPPPRADIFVKLENLGGSIHLDTIWNTVEVPANEVVRADFVAQHRDDAR